MSMNSANYVMGYGYQNTAVENYREEARENNYLALRRAQDVILSGAAMIALSPLLAGVALAIVLDDPKGGPIYTQTRCGKDGKEFKLYKFRSMCVNADQRQRLSVTPGLTCIWQVQPNRNELSFGEWVELDLEYIKKRNLFPDWKLIFQTVNAVLCGYGE